MISQSSETDDHRLLERLAGTDMQALAAIYAAYSDLVYHLLLAWLADEQRAEELLIDVFMALVQRGRGVARIRDLRAYLLRRVVSILQSDSAVTNRASEGKVAND